VGLSGRREPSPEGGRGAGLRALEIRGADKLPEVDGSWCMDKRMVMSG
jgi:hypothetical protein